MVGQKRQRQSGSKSEREYEGSVMRLRGLTFVG